VTAATGLVTESMYAAGARIFVETALAPDSVRAFHVYFPDPWPKKKQKKRFPEEPQRDVLLWLIHNAPLEHWQRDVLEIVRDEAYYFAPQRQTKILNEGWASYWHSRLMTEKILKASEIIDYADHNAGVLATAPGQFNPYKIGIELLRDVEERWDKGRFGREWNDCQNLDERRVWDKRVGLGRKKIFEVRKLYNDVTFIDEFFTADFCERNKFFSFSLNERSGNYEIDSREFQKIKHKILFSLTNFGDPFIFVEDSNHENRGELLGKITGGPNLVRSLVQMDAPDHPKYRALTQAWFMPVNLGKFEERVRTIARGAVERMVSHGGRCDFVADIALGYPLHVIMEILGVPEQDEPRMLKLTQELFGPQDPDTARVREQLSAEQFSEMIVSIVNDFGAYFGKITEDRRANPKDDLATVIANGKINGAYLPPLDITSYYMIVATAGHDTTSSSTAGAKRRRASAGR